MTGRLRPPTVQSGGIAAVGIGVGLLVAGIGYVVVTDVARSFSRLIVEGGLVVGTPVLVVYGVVAFLLDEFHNDDLWQIALWGATGLATSALLVNGIIWQQYWEGVVVSRPMFGFLALGNIGTGVGMVLGASRARAVESARSAERAETAARLAEQEQSRLTYLNHVLRHHVLNGMNIIQGHADQLPAYVPPEGTPHLDIIQRESDRIVELVRNVRVMVESLEKEPNPQPVDLNAVLREEITAARTSYDAEFTIDGKLPDATVKADAWVPLLFENLLSNAVEHNDSDRPAVCVDAERNGERAVVRIADNGPGLPPEVQETLDADPGDLNRSENVGLYLVRLLADRSNGDVWADVDADSGTTVTVELPLA